MTTRILFFEYESHSQMFVCGRRATFSATLSLFSTSQFQTSTDRFYSDSRFNTSKLRPGYFLLQREREIPRTYMLRGRRLHQWRKQKNKNKNTRETRDETKHTHTRTTGCFLKERDTSYMFGAYWPRQQMISSYGTVDRQGNKDREKTGSDKPCCSTTTVVRTQENVRENNCTKGKKGKQLHKGEKMKSRKWHEKTRRQD